MGRNKNASPSFVQSDGGFMTDSKEIADYFNNHFINKVGNLRKGFRTE